jgi:hypothetical protein
MAASIYSDNEGDAASKMEPLIVFIFTREVLAHTLLDLLKLSNNDPVSSSNS